MIQQLILDILPPSPQTLDNFLGSENNAVVHALRDQCVPGRAFYLWGPPGAGRSHLLRAVSHAQGIYFEPGHDPQTLKALATDETAAYKVVAVDDIDMLNDKGQAALFSLYNRWRECAAAPDAFALVVAGSHAPMAMSIREDLRTRLGWDLSFRLHLLSDDERAQALATRAHERGLKLNPDVISWLLLHYSRDMSQLSSLIDALDRYSLQRHRPITLPLLKDLLASSPGRVTSKE